jgi:proline racemase
VLDATTVGCAVEPAYLPRLIELGREIKAGLEATRDVVHPVVAELRDIYGVIFVDATAQGGDGGLRQRNVAVFADGEVDRSPTGSGVSARLALLDAAGTLPRGAPLVTAGIAGPTFTGWVMGEAEVAGVPAVHTEVEGSAYRTGSHVFVLDPEDPLGTGFLLR